MTIYEIEKKTKYFAADLILEDCLDNDGEIDFDKALKKILSNNFACGIDDWWDSIELRDVPEISISSEGQYREKDLEVFIEFIKMVVKNAKEKRTETYLKYSQLFDRLIKDCEDYVIIDGGYNEYFSIEIFENLDLPSIISDEYTKQWEPSTY